jgi:hypothetical protein
VLQLLFEQRQVCKWRCRPKHPMQCRSQTSFRPSRQS